jgi:Zn-dependent protease
MELNLIQKILIYALPVIFAITLHEAAHGYVARYFGDTTAYVLGRVSLNPLRHIDPIGTVLIPLISLAIGGMLFGWAKPVPVNFNQLRDPKRDMFWVAAAGPAANLGMIVFWAFIAKFATLVPWSIYSLPLGNMGEAGIQINTVIMVLNLLPLPPLDGGRIAVSLLPRDLSYRFAKLEPYGMMILVLLLFSNVLNRIIGPFIYGTYHAVEQLFGI